MVLSASPGHVMHSPFVIVVFLSHFAGSGQAWLALVFGALVLLLITNSPLVPKKCHYGNQKCDEIRVNFSVNSFKPLRELLGKPSKILWTSCDIPRKPSNPGNTLRKSDEIPWMSYEIR